MSRRLTTEEFIEQSIVIHGDKYDYDEVVYIRCCDDVTITCREHGNFNQRPEHHRRGHGCASCSNSNGGGGHNRLTKNQFVTSSKVTHGDKYDYSNVLYKSNNDKVTITCRKHGDFNQRPSDHMTGQGCAACSGNQRGSTVGFIVKSKKIHGDKYSYSNVIYKNTKMKVIITCGLHGDFEQSPCNHMKGKGCPSCAVNGYNPDIKGHMYFLLSDDSENVKIGVSNNPRQRFKSLKSATPFGFSVLEIFEGEGKMIHQKEQFYHKLLMSAELKGFSGSTEWFKYNGEMIDCLRDDMRGNL